MHSTGTLRLAVSIIAATAVADSVSAQDPADEAPPSEVTDATSGTPTSYIQRPLTLRARTLRADAAPSDFGLMDSGELLGPSGPFGGYGIRVGQFRSKVRFPAPIGNVRTTDMYGAMGLGASYGLIDRIEVGALVLPINFGDFGGRDNAFGNIAVYGRAALVEGDFSLGVQTTLSIPTYDDLGVGVGMPIDVRVGDGMRLETGVEGEFFFDVDDDSGGRRINIDAPFAASFGIGDGFVGVRTGVTVLDLGGVNDLVIPAGGTGGYSFVAGSTLVDLKAAFTWSFLVDGDPDVRSQFWTVMFGANVHFEL